jgi:hypothetical protein
VAQLGARFHGMEEVVGSIPTRSTKFSILSKQRSFDSLRSLRISPAGSTPAERLKFDPDQIHQIPFRVFDPVLESPRAFAISTGYRGHDVGAIFSATLPR